MSKRDIVLVLCVYFLISCFSPNHQLQTLTGRLLACPAPFLPFSLFGPRPLHVPPHPPARPRSTLTPPCPLHPKRIINWRECLHHENLPRCCQLAVPGQVPNCTASQVRTTGTTWETKEVHKPANKIVEFPRSLTVLLHYDNLSGSRLARSGLREVPAKTRRKPPSHQLLKAGRVDARQRGERNTSLVPAKINSKNHCRVLDDSISSPAFVVSCSLSTLPQPSLPSLHSLFQHYETQYAAHGMRCPHVASCRH